MSANKKPYGLQYRDAVMKLAAMRGAKHGKLNVLRAILQSCNGQIGTAYPGNKLIMERANTTSKDTLWRAITFLEAQGIIRRVGYPDGGRGKSVNWGFGLPAWTTPDNLHEVLRSAENLPENRGDIGAGGEGENLPENASIPPRNCVNTSPKTGEPTKGTKKNPREGTGYAVASKGPPSRRQAAPLRPQTPEEQALFSQWEGQFSYSYAMDALRDWRKQQRMAAE